MKKVMIVATLLSALVGIASAVQAKHTNWVKTFWEEQDRNSGGN